MRVYEFAKEHGLISKDLIVLLSKQGFDVSSHMAVLSDEALQFLKKNFEKKTEGSPQIQQPAMTPVAPAVAAQAPTVIAPAKSEPVPAAPVVFPKVLKEEKKVLEMPQPTPEKIVPVGNVILLKPQILSDLSIALGKPSSEVIVTLLKWGILSNKNQLLPEDLVARLAQHYEIPTMRPVVEKVQEQKIAKTSLDKSQLQERLPIVVIMGHVDHGKTTLLDFIRKTRVAAREKGGITQHLGAYEAKTPHGNLVFIDTPGHEAFSKIRMRGTKVADIVILVVAADDGVMPQTIEALKQAQAMDVPIIVAINKIDKVDKTRADVVKRELATQHNLLPEEWGGQTLYIPISAKTGEGVDKLLEMLILQSQLMELQSHLSGFARGFVLESKLEKGRGAVATILTHYGTLAVGDYFVAGKTTGKVSSMVDSYGNKIQTVAPSVPVQVAGFNELPEAGDSFEVVDKDAYFKSKNIFSGQKTFAQRTVHAENSIVLIIKTDTNSSKEALVESIAKAAKKGQKGFLILQAGLGNVNESDVMLASDTGARIVTLHVKSEANAALMAGRLGVTIMTFDIIYKLLESLQDLSLSMVPVKMVRTKVGEAFVRKVFDIKNLGVIAGCYVKQGIFSRDGMVIIWRGTKKVGEGKISSLQRDKNPVKEVHAGYECAFMIEDFKDWHVDDRVECFLERPEVKK